MAVGRLGAAPILKTVRSCLKRWSCKKIKISRPDELVLPATVVFLVQSEVGRWGPIPGVVKLLSMLDPSQDSTALSTDGSVLNALWLDGGVTRMMGSSSPS